jgi:hypothetical protein
VCDEDLDRHDPRLVAIREAMSEAERRNAYEQLRAAGEIALRRAWALQRWRLNRRAK